MANTDEVLEVFDFSGGRNSYDPEFLVQDNQSINCQNINLLDRGFEKRRGNVAFNTSAMVDATTAIVGMGYFKLNSGTEFLNAIAGTKFFTSASLTGTMADTTGAVTITAGQNNKWKPVLFNALQIWFGGAPDAPFKYSGTGSAAALGGSPPSARTAFVANNRVFAIRTDANPSRIHWSVLSDPEDWTGTGSGNSDVNKNDGEDLLTGVVLNADIALLFKNTSTHYMFLSQPPFAIFQIQKGVGAAGPDAVVNVNGTIYFITPQGRMKSTTDGKTFEDYPNAVNDLWDGGNSSRIKFIHGIYYPSLYQIHWLNSMGSSTTHDNSIIWDLKRKAWLTHPTGFRANTACLVQDRRLFTGHYNGKLFEQDKAATFSDASEATPGAIDAFWQTPWYRAKSLSDVVHPRWLDFSCLSESTGTIDVSYGFEFATPSNTETFSLVTGTSKWDVAQWDVDVWGGTTSLIKRKYVLGRGNVFSAKFRNANAGQTFTFQGFTVQNRPSRHQKLNAVA